MLHKMTMAAPLAGMLALSPAASDEEVHAAQFSPPSYIGASPLLQPVRGGSGGMCSSTSGATAFMSAAVRGGGRGATSEASNAE
jgi:hypothetical protein